MIYHTIYYTILYYTILYYTILYYTILYYTMLCYTILYSTITYAQAHALSGRSESRRSQAHCYVQHTCVACHAAPSLHALLYTSTIARSPATTRRCSPIDMPEGQPNAGARPARRRTTEPNATRPHACCAGDRRVRCRPPAPGE